MSTDDLHIFLSQYQWEIVCKHSVEPDSTLIIDLFSFVYGLMSRVEKGSRRELEYIVKVECI